MNYEPRIKRLESRVAELEKKLAQIPEEYDPELYAFHEKKAERVLFPLLVAMKRDQIKEINRRFRVERARELYGTSRFDKWFNEVKKLLAT